MGARFDEGTCDAGPQPKTAAHRSLAQGQGLLKNGDRQRLCRPRDSSGVTRRQPL